MTLCYIFSITKESIVDVKAVVKSVPKQIESCSQKDVEVHLEEVFVASAAKPQLPLQIEDAARSVNEADETTLNIRVNQDTRLDNRVLDLRTPANQAIFRVEAAICKLFRDILTEKVSVTMFVSTQNNFIQYLSSKCLLFRALLRSTLPRSSPQLARVVRMFLRYLISRATLTWLNRLSYTSRWRLLLISTKFSLLEQVLETTQICLIEIKSQ